MYKRVIILGVDGAGNFVAQAETPHIDALFASGAVTYEGMTSIPTISAECWGSMLLGAGPQTHSLTNDIVSTRPYDISSLHPSIFRVVRAAMPQAKLASFCNWDPINTGIIEENLGIDKFTASSDAAICEQVLQYLDAHDPALVFVQFDEVDGAGHRHGYGTPQFLAKLTEIDALIGRIVAKYRDKGRADDTLFIVSADHGGNQNNHGGDSLQEVLIFMGFAGHSVQQGMLSDVNVMDIAAIAATALGCELPAAWEATMPQTLFAAP
ncbi:MAG: alkaline phosphatase family protein [Oscillospiraceae bacterium]|jgi:predicted AlkP superfamily pyrophosphatase or phosphodiesterase|nr:alkaline phosphatase family protein [Oscillospiraceae bacterium]